MLQSRGEDVRNESRQETANPISLVEKVVDVEEEAPKSRYRKVFSFFYEFSEVIKQKKLCVTCV